MHGIRTLQSTSQSPPTVTSWLLYPTANVCIVRGEGFTKLTNYGEVPGKLTNLYIFGVITITRYDLKRSPRTAPRSSESSRLEVKMHSVLCYSERQFNSRVLVMTMQQFMQHHINSRLTVWILSGSCGISRNITSACHHNAATQEAYLFLFNSCLLT